MAVSSTDSAPALIALGARVLLRSRSEDREVALADLYNNDSVKYLARRHNEILSEIRLGALQGWRSTYWKLRRRGSFDFPVLSVAAAARFSRNVWWILSKKVGDRVTKLHRRTFFDWD